MAASPKFKIHNTDGEYVASCKYAEDAAALVALYGAGAKIKLWSKVVWNEGSETQSAGESFDFVRETVDQRERDMISGVQS